MRRAAFAHLETWRPYTLGHVGLVGLAGAVLAGHHPGPARLAAAWAIPTLAWIAALYGGDYFDRKLDAAAKPHRPIPSGRIAPRTALACMIGCTVAGGTAAAALNWRTLVLVLAALLLAIAYNGFFKARGFAGNAARGSLTALAFLFGAMLAAPYPSWRVLPVAALLWIHDAGSNLVGALRDVEGDRAAGYRTLPVRRGSTRTLQVVAGLFAGWLALAAFAPYPLPRLRDGWYAALAWSAALLAAVTLAMLVRSGRPVPRRTAYRAHEILVVERILLGGALLGGALWNVPVLLGVLAVTVLSQTALRGRHEFGPSDQPSLTAREVLDYIDEQLTSLASGPPLSGLRGWDRSIGITLTDLDLEIGLLAENGALRRTDPGGRDGVQITTTSAVFRDIFLLGRSNPRRAVLTRQIRAKAEPRDLLHLNQLFNEFRRRRPPTGFAVTERRPEPAEPAELPPSVVLSDTTLRDGEQAPGVAFNPAAKIALATRLAALGVPLIEVGFPAVSAEEVEAIRGIVAADLDAVIQVIARPVERDIAMAVESGAHSIAVFVGTSDAHIERKLRTDRKRLLRTIHDGVAQAKKSGRQVVFAAEDATRTDPDYLATVLYVAANAGADAIGLADTVGIATPWSIAELVRFVAADCPLPIAVHCHDDLGLATANSLAALRAGASGVQCSVLGIGERAGNASLEEVALTLEVACGHRTGLDLAALTPLAEDVAVLSGQSIMPGKAVVGRNAFLHESGLHTSGIIRDPETYEPYPPELTGRARGFAAGKHSGRSGIQHILARHAVVLDDPALDGLMESVKQREYAGLPLEEAELLRLAELAKGVTR